MGVKRYEAKINLAENSAENNRVSMRSEDRIVQNKELRLISCHRTIWCAKNNFLARSCSFKKKVFFP